MLDEFGNTLWSLSRRRYRMIQHYFKKTLGNNWGTICHQFSFHEWRPFRTVCHCDKGGIWLSTTLTSGNRYPVWLNCIIHIDFQSGPFQSLLMQLWWLLVKLFLLLSISLYFLLFSGINHSFIRDLLTSRESPFHYKFVYSFACPLSCQQQSTTRENIHNLEKFLIKGNVTCIQYPFSW